MPSLSSASILRMTAGLLVGASMAVGSWQAMAQSQRTKMIVPYGKGGGSDQLSRAMAKSVEQISQTRFDITNVKKGAGLGAIPGFMALPANGYNVIEHIDDIAAAYAIGATNVHPARDWEPLAIVQLAFSQLFIKSDDTRFSDWKSFLAYAKANPKKVVVANVSYDGSMENITMRKLEAELGFETRQVSFDNIKDRYEAVFLGRADALFEQPGDVRSYLDSGRLKPVLTFFNERPSAFANVPTHKEVGAKFEPLLRFRGFFVKKGTPTQRLTYLQNLFASAYKTPSFQKFNESKYMTIIDPFRDPKSAKQLINQTITSYSKSYQDFLAQTLNEYFKRN